MNLLQARDRGRHYRDPRLHVEDPGAVELASTLPHRHRVQRACWPNRVEVTEHEDRLAAIMSPKRDLQMVTGLRLRMQHNSPAQIREAAGRELRHPV